MLIEPQIEHELKVARSEYRVFEREGDYRSFLIMSPLCLHRPHQSLPKVTVERLIFLLRMQNISGHYPGLKAG